MIRRVGECAAILFLAAGVTLAEVSNLTSIFNEENLDGWVLPEGNIWWTVKDGVCTGQSDAKKRGSILWTETKYRDFVLELDFRVGSEGVVDSGVFLRHEQDQIQIGISGSKKRDMTASPFIAGRGYPVEADGVADLLKPKDWNTLRIRVEGPSYTVWLNGKNVMSYTSDTALEQGPIGLQMHAGRKMRIDFRALRVAEL
jgi:hypothetical protein